MTLMPLVELEPGWCFMEKGITKLKRIIEGASEPKFTAEEYIMLYTTSYNMCCQHPPHCYSSELYKRCKDAFEGYVSSEVLPSIRKSQDESLLAVLVKRWDNQKILTRWLSHFFSCVDRSYVYRTNLPDLTNVGLSCFCDMVYPEVKTRILPAMIRVVDREREGEPIDGVLLEKVLETAQEIGGESFEGDFREIVLAETAAYYSRLAASWIEECSVAEYMTRAEECLKREEHRVGYHLQASTRDTLVEVVKQELLSKYQNQLLEKVHSNCLAALRDDRVEDLTNLYRLLARIPLGFACMFRDHVKKEGIALVKQAEDNGKREKYEKKDTRAFVSNLIELQAKYTRYVSECFDDNFVFYSARTEAFEVLCNKTVGGSTSAEILATFSDGLLRRGGIEKLSDEDLQGKMRAVVTLLEYIRDKDLFFEIYRKRLARGLLNGKNLDLDRERTMLALLKQEFGRGSTSKMEGMITDLLLAKKNQTSFEKSSMRKTLASNHGIDLNVSVLTTGIWPAYKSADLAPPTEFLNCIQAFTEFYQTKTKHRNLTWMYSLGTCTVNARFQREQIELIVTPYQAAALLLFNASERLSYLEIQNRLNLAEEDLNRLLHSLSRAKHKILTKDPATIAVGRKDFFQFNSKFTHQARRLRIPPPSVAVEDTKVIEKLESDRRYAMDACIVRIMKRRRESPQEELVVECAQQLGGRFRPDPKVIEKRIEHLIQRQFLEGFQPSMLRYVP